MLPPDKDEPKKSAAGNARRGQRRGRAKTDEESQETEPVGAKSELSTEDAAAVTDPAPKPEAEAGSPGATDDTDRDVAVADEPPPSVAEVAEPLAEAPKQSEPVTSASAAPPPPPAKSGGRFWPALLGALVGAALGAGAVWYMLQQMPREPDPTLTAALDGQSGQISAQADRLASSESEIATIKETIAANDLSGAIDSLRSESDERLRALDDGLSGLGGRIDALEGRIGEIGEQIVDIGSRLDEGDARVVELEARPIADPETANQVLRSEVADMRQEVDAATEAARAQVDTMRNELTDAAATAQASIEEAQRRAAELEAQARERAAATEADAEAAARAAESSAAMARVLAALDSGEPYGDALAGLGSEAPEALAGMAESGVPTLGELRESFPDAARAALSASRVASSEGEPVNRLMAFFRTQTQARSLTPQEGDTPDAILSRAESALDGGNVAAALTEVGSLPEDGRAAMQGWIDSAETRAAAVAAADTLSQSMN